MQINVQGEPRRSRGAPRVLLRPGLHTTLAGVSKFGTYAGTMPPLVELAEEAAKIAEAIRSSKKKYLGMKRAHTARVKKKKADDETPEKTVQDKSNKQVIVQSAFFQNLRGAASPRKAAKVESSEAKAITKSETGAGNNLRKAVKAEPPCNSESPKKKKESPKKTSPKKKDRVCQIADWDYQRQSANMWFRGKHLTTNNIRPEFPGDLQSKVIAKFEGVAEVRVAGIWWEVVVAGRRAAASSAAPCAPAPVFRHMATELSKLAKGKKRKAVL